MDEIIANDVQNGLEKETTQPTIPLQKSQEITPQLRYRKTRPALQLLLILVALCGLVTFGYFKNQGSPTKQPLLTSETPQPQNKEGQAESSEFGTVPEFQVPDTSTITDSSLTGTIKLISQDLQLFKEDVSEINGTIVPPVYYEAGTFTTGEYQGYRRIIGVITANTFSGGGAYVFLTKDDQKYFVQKLPEFPTVSHLDENLFSDKVILADNLPTEHPISIPLDDHFVLYRQEIPTRPFVTQVNDKFNQTIGRNVLEDTYPDLARLNSPVKSVAFFAQGSQKPNYVGEIPPEVQRAEEMREAYFQTSTAVFVTDSTGLTYQYDLSTPKIVADYYPALEKFEQEYEVYQAAQEKYQSAAEAYEKKITQGLPAERPIYPDYPESVGSPYLSFAKGEITSSEPLMNSYKSSFPGTCGTEGNTDVLKNVKQEELKQIGTIGNQPVWVLADSQHPLLKYAYETKITNTSEEGFPAVNKGATKPSYEAYIAQNPLLIIQDYWGRFVTLGEWDYLLEGGCGKPVVYLYPETDTNVSVRFTGQVDLTTDIPDYHGSWNVLAHPNGILENLQSNNCADPDFAKFGSEYAQEACRANAYPYLFWAGNVLDQAYPQIDEGWIVSSSELDVFLTTKLAEVGLNAQESTDMLSYWLPKMRSEQADYYRVAFLQTAEMNALAPMEILPQPQTLFRIFLDWEPLQQKPEVLPQPQRLNTLQRQGFTVVEWGGLNR